jgi:hypothetical protein
VLSWCGRPRSGLPTVSSRWRQGALVGGGVPAGIGGRLGLGEHERGSGKLARGLMRAKDARWRLSTVTRGSPERKSGAAVVIGGPGSGKMAEELGKRDVGTLVVLTRAKDEALGFCSGLSTAAVRWQPSRAPGSRGARGGGQQGRGTGPERGKWDAWRERKQEVDARRPAQQRPGKLHRRQSRGGRGAEGLRGRRREGKGPKDLCVKLKDSRGLAVKQNFPLI